MNNFSIKDLAEFSGVKQHTIRTWEQRFSILCPERDKALRRFYSAKELNAFLDITFINKSGYKVSRIAQMTSIEKNDILDKLKPLQPQLKAINELIICMAEMDTESFEMILNNYVAVFGIFQTIEDIILPFAKRIGLFQRIECKNYIENIALIIEQLKQKIYTGIELLQPGNIRQQSLIIFSFQQENENPELVFLHYFLKKKGFQVMYPNYELTIKQIELICRCKTPDWIIIKWNEEKNKRYLRNFISHFPKCFGKAKAILLANNLPDQQLAGSCNYADSLQVAIDLVSNGCPVQDD